MNKNITEKSTKSIDLLLDSFPDSLFTIAGKYDVIREIGHGAQGKIFLANCRSNNKLVVVKQLNINSIKTWKEYELFQREAEVLKSLNFEGIAKFYDAIECLDDEPPCSYIVQEYIKGISLQKMLNEGHRFSVNDVYDILIQLLNIVDKLQHHDPPVIHRDIKPSNLMISSENDRELKVTVIDFGAVANPQLKGGGSTVAGTFGYMPPEQLTGKPVPATDIYAVGALAVQLFTGISPADIPSKDFRLIFEPLMQDKPHELVSLLRQMLEPKVDARLADIAEIIHRLKNYQKGIFNNKNNQSNSSSNNYSDKYVNQLLSVQCICEPGNLEIWQHLSDQTPRSVPTPYLPERIEDGYDSAIERKSRQKHWNLSQASLFILFRKPTRLIEFILLISNWLLVLSGFMFFYFLLNETVITTKMGFTAFIIAFLILGTIYLFSRAFACSTQLQNNESPYEAFEDRVFNNRNLDFEKTKLAKDMLNNCLTDGRKSIATIVGVKYLPSNITLFVQSTSVSMCENPRFVVQYKFNPPDDKRQEDIIHQFVTHIEPEHHYNIGDPLPILYYIQDHYFYDTVYSIPYPICLPDVAQYTDLVCWSSSKHNDVQTFAEISLADKLLLDLKNASCDLEIKYLLNSVTLYKFQGKDLKKILKQIFSMLQDITHISIHAECIQAIPKLFSLPDSEGRELLKDEYFSIKAKQMSKLFADYLNVKPRNSHIPSFQAVNEIIQVCVQYNHCIYLFPTEFWDALVDVHNDPAVSPKAKKTIYQYLQQAAQSSNDMRTYFEHLQV